MKFIDETKITAIAGDGGSGAVSWRREKYLPKGGPDGGDGGNGGAVLLTTDPGINTLMDCALNPILKARPGDPGGSNGKTGKSGIDCVRRVPIGTQVFFNEQMVADLSVEGAQWVAARGGRGGKGNAHFKSATNQAPTHAQPGTSGEQREYRLVLKSVADIGLVGLPNAGKSSLVSAITEAHPLAADYPFTTLQPTLGVILLDEKRRCIIADIPGIIKGAASGKGLGIQFLRHIERTSVLAHVIDVNLSEKVQRANTEGKTLSSQELGQIAREQYVILNTELDAFNPELRKRSRLIFFSKSDLPLQKEAFLASSEWIAKEDIVALQISSQTQENLDETKAALMTAVENSRKS